MKFRIYFMYDAQFFVYTYSRPLQHQYVLVVSQIKVWQINQFKILFGLVDRTAQTLEVVH